MDKNEKSEGPEKKKKNAKSVLKKESEKPDAKIVRAKYSQFLLISRSGKQKEEKSLQTQTQKKNYEELKKEKLQLMILLYCQILLLVRRYNECLKFISSTIKGLVFDGD